jgi:hypothetical protein
MRIDTNYYFSISFLKNLDNLHIYCRIGVSPPLLSRACHAPDYHRLYPKKEWFSSEAYFLISVMPLSSIASRLKQTRFLESPDPSWFDHGG